MKKLFALLLAISTVIMFGCKAKTPATASSSSSDLDVQVIAPVSSEVSSEVSSAADSSASSSSSSSKTVSPQPKTITSSSSSRATNSASSNDKLIAEENTRHTAALKSLEDTYNANMAVFDEIGRYSQLQIPYINSLNVETDSTKKADLRNQINNYTFLIVQDLKKVVPILYPDLKYMNSLDDFKQYFLKRNRVNVSDKVLRNEMQQKYDKDVAGENSKHDAIIKQLS